MKGNDMFVKVDQRHILLKRKIIIEGHDQSFC